MTDAAELEVTPAENPAEMAECALINFDNLRRLLPYIGGHPMYELAMHQLRCAIAGMEAKQDD